MISRNEMGTFIENSNYPPMTHTVRTRYVLDRRDCKYYYTENNERVELPGAHVLPTVYVDFLEPIQFDNPNQVKVKCRLYLTNNEIVIGYIYYNFCFPFRIEGYKFQFDGRFNNPAFSGTTK